MRRHARLDAPGTLHHVVVRGIERTTVFRDDRDRADFVARLGRLAPVLGLHPAVVYQAARRGAAQASEWEKLLAKMGKTA